MKPSRPDRESWVRKALKLLWLVISASHLLKPSHRHERLPRTGPSKSGILPPRKDCHYHTDMSYKGKWAWGEHRSCRSLKAGPSGGRFSARSSMNCWKQDVSGASTPEITRLAHGKAIPRSQPCAFEAIGRLGGVRKGASALGLDPAVVSRRLKMIEEWTDVPLFERSVVYIGLTPAGSLFHTRVLASARADRRYGYLDGVCRHCRCDHADEHYRPVPTNQ
ncbi:LysR family transcriptional regulator [Sphingopyxis sp.]|uniref:helix-turn-helix domain-containing protein n=1 Tax=Sphingopyxis sp. TaxID=1908224 RepID=UPI00345A8EAD